MATQDEVGEYIDLTGRQVRNLQSMGIIHSAKGRGNLNLKRAIHEYINHLRAGGEIAPPDPSDQATEEDNRYKRIRTDILEERLRILQREHAPIELLEIALFATLEGVNAMLDTLIMKAKMADPEISPEALNALEEVVIDAKNTCSKGRIDLIGYIEHDPEGDQDLLEDLGNQGAADGE